MKYWLAGLALVWSEAALAQHKEASEPPTLTITRYDEDWARLADPAEGTGRWTEPFKYVALGDDDYLTTGIEVRLRHEGFTGNVWGSAPDDGYLWQRAMPYADLHLGKVRAFVQPVAAYAAGVAGGPGPIDQTRVDLLQGFADMELGSGDDTLTLRGGRQMLSLGTERLIGTRYGPNVPLAFDGVRAIVRHSDLSASIFYVRPVQPGPDSFDDRTSRAKALWGVYATRGGIDLYYLGYRNDRATFDTGSARELRHSLGLRYSGAADAWSWNLEGIAQFGRFGGGNIRAWSIGSQLARSFAVPLAPVATVRFNIVSGDRNPGDGTLGTFNALFPKGKYFGELSPIGPYNIVNLQPGIALDLGGEVTAGLVGALYWRYSAGDGIYDIPGTLLRSAGAATARFIGKQAEATLDWQATPELELSASLSAFAPGGFIRQTGPARTIVMTGLEANFRF